MKALGIDAYPLCWPAGRPRIIRGRRQRARFDVSFAVARDQLMREIQLLGGRDPVLSTNVALRRDYLPYANQAEPEDVGAAAYFVLRGKQFAFACDRWDRVRDNIQAIRHTISALRGIERWGTGDMVQAAFTGFAALPAPTAVPTWRAVLGVGDTRDLAEVEAAYRSRRKSTHPDHGGSAEEFDLVQRAWNMALQDLSS